MICEPRCTRHDEEQRPSSVEKTFKYKKRKKKQQFFYVGDERQSQIKHRVTARLRDDRPIEGKESEIGDGNGNNGHGKHLHKKKLY